LIIPIWTNLDSQNAIASFLAEFGGFHDACLRQLLVSTETFVANNLSMSCPGHLDTTVLLFLQSQSGSLPAVEIKCERVTGVRIMPSPDGCDSIVMSGTIANEGEIYRLALHLMGAPLRGEPNSRIFVIESDQPDIEVAAQAMAWRPAPDGLGERLLYVPREGG
jgi:hypothetical protein